MFSTSFFVPILLAISSLSDAAAIAASPPSLSALPFNDLSKRSNGFLKIDFDVLSTLNTAAPILQARDEIPLGLQTKEIFYLAELYVGSDKQKNGVDIDTGSSDLWVIDSSSGFPGDYGVFNHSSSTSYKDTGVVFNTSYGDKSTVSGNYATDDVSFGIDGPTIKSLTFGNADYMTIVRYGIFGIGLKATEAATTKYDNFPYALKAQGLIEKTAYSIYLNDTGSPTGSVIFGGIDHAKYIGSLQTYPVLSEKYFKIQAKSLSLNGQSVDAPAFILDSGTTISKLEPSRLGEVAKLAGATHYDQGYGFYYWSNEDEVPDNFTVEFEGLSVIIPKQDLIWDHITSTGYSVPAFAFFPMEDLNILGDNFLRHVYSVYDLDDKTVQLANIKYTDESDVTSIS